MDGVAGEGGRRRRTHSAEFKARVMQACGHPGVSIASVALSHGLNANLVRRWLSGETRVAWPVLWRWVMRTRCGGLPLGLLERSCRCNSRRPTHRHQMTFDSSCAVGPPPSSSTGRPEIGGLRQLAVRAVAVIRIDAMWLASEPVDMRAGADRLLARVVQVFGAARAHHGYLFANSRVDAHQVAGARRLRGVVCGAAPEHGRLRVAGQAAAMQRQLTLTADQFGALVLGLPWQRLEQMRVITRM